MKELKVKVTLTEEMLGTASNNKEIHSEYIASKAPDAKSKEEEIEAIGVDAEIEKMEAQLKHLEGFLQGVMKKLSNERFVANAPEAVVAMERKKQSDSEEKIAALRESIAALKAQK